MIIGIIGGGQLGMMIAEASKEYNHTIIGLDPNPRCPLSYIADELIVADYNDEKAFERLAKKCDVLTYEFENVDLNLVKRFENKIPQKGIALLLSRNRITEKQFARELEIPVPKFIKYGEEDVFFPSIIKTTTGGYDGKGQHLLRNESDVDRLCELNDNEWIVEELIEFDYEISVVVTRDTYGNEEYYPVPINKHRKGILFTSTISNELNPLIVSKAKKYTSKIIKRLDYVGTMAVEYFVKEGNVIFNEFAPRPHNSGHYTIEGCTVSQFKNHILAITKKEVLKSELIKPTIMINVLGQDNVFIKRANELNVCYYNYKKDISKTDRKMGHITIVSDNKKDAEIIKNHIIEE